MRKEILLGSLLNLTRRKNVLQNTILTEYTACLQHQYQTKQKRLHQPVSCFVINSKNKK